MKQSRRIITAVLLMMCLILTVLPVSALAEASQPTKTLTYWRAMGNSAMISSWNNSPMLQHYEEVTGIHVEYISPPIGQENEQFSLMVASNDLPDIIQYNWNNYPGGAAKAIEDGVIMALTEEHLALVPELMKYYEEDELLDKLAKSDDGQYYCFPYIRGEGAAISYFGPVLRADWLEELGLEVPDTIDEWTHVLRTFKEAKGLDYALSFTSFEPFIFGAYESASTMFQIDGTVDFGPLQPGYLTALTVLNEWYEEGLLDPDFISQDSATLNAKITGDKVGAALLSVGGGIGTLTNMMAGQPFELVAAPWPSAEEGGIATAGQKSFRFDIANAAAITTSCEDVEAALEWLNFCYAEEGFLHMNFGLEGETYEFEGEVPMFNDYVWENAEGFTWNDVINAYTWGGSGGPFFTNWKLASQTLRLPQQQDALAKWEAFDDTRRMPPLTLTTEESTRYAALMNEIETYVSEMQLKFITGITPLGDFDKFTANIEKLGIAECIEIQQAAMDRFNQR